MKRIRIIPTTALLLLLGIGFPADARQEKPEKQEEKAKPEKPEQQAKPERQKQDTSAKPEERQQAKGQQEQQTPQWDNSAKQQRQDNSAKQQEKARAQQRCNAAAVADTCRRLSALVAQPGLGLLSDGRRRPRARGCCGSCISRRHLDSSRVPNLEVVDGRIQT